MNKPMLAAAVISALTFGLHVIGGGADVHTPIQASTLPLPLRAISAVLWHFVSLILALQSLGFISLARASNRDLSLMLIGIQIGTAVLFVFYGMTMLGSVWIIPQWTIFLTIAALGLWGLWRR